MNFRDACFRTNPCEGIGEGNITDATGISWDFNGISWDNHCLDVGCQESSNGLYDIFSKRGFSTCDWGVTCLSFTYHIPHLREAGCAPRIEEVASQEEG